MVAKYNFAGNRVANWNFATSGILYFDLGEWLNK